jgi:hypothetical protein
VAGGCTFLYALNKKEREERIEKKRVKKIEIK